MRKHNEGYALPLVLVVMVVLCLVAMTMMSVSLRNMENQRASIERMQDQYIAEGAIEAVLAEMDNTNAVTITTDGANRFEDALTYRLKSYCESVNKDVVTVAGNPVYEATDVHGEIVFTFTLVAVSGNVQVTCDMEMRTTLAGNDTNYLLSDTKFTYKAYTISTVAEGGEAA